MDIIGTILSFICLYFLACFSQQKDAPKSQNKALVKMFLYYFFGFYNSSRFVFCHTFCKKQAKKHSFF